MTHEEELNKAAEEAAREVYTYTFQGMDDLIGLFKAGYKLAMEQFEPATFGNTTGTTVLFKKKDE